MSYLGCLCTTEAITKFLASLVVLAVIVLANHDTELGAALQRHLRVPVVEAVGCCHHVALVQDRPSAHEASSIAGARRNQNLVGKLVFSVHFLSSNNPVRRRHWGAVTSVDGPLLKFGSPTQR